MTAPGVPSTPPGPVAAAVRRLACLLALAACDAGTEDGAPCGDVLTCAAGEFCLVIFPEGSDYGDQSYTCEPVPQGCDSFDDMCTSDPPCGDDWAETYCEGVPSSVGCSTFGDVEEAVCEY